MPRGNRPGKNGDTDEETEDRHVTLRVTVHSAVHLLAKDLNGKSDPFVRVSVDGNAVHRTRTLKGDLNPVWNESFELDFSELPDPGQLGPEIKFEVLNEYKFGKMTGTIQNIGKQSFLGQVVFHLADFVGANMPEPRTNFELQKRTFKSHVRGSLQLTFQLLQNGHDMTLVTGSNPTPENAVMLSRSPSSMGHRRKKSYFSVAEMAEMAETVSGRALTPGNYLLKLRFLKAMEVPVVDKKGEVPVFFHVSLGSNKSKTDEFILNAADQLQTLPLDNTEVGVPVTVKTHEITHPIRITILAINLVKVPQFLGQATMPLGTVPVLDDEEAVAHLLPVDIFLERKKFKILPPYLKLQGHGSICRLRVKAWLIDQGSAGDSDLSDEFDDDDDVDAEADLMETPETLPPEYEWTLAEDTFPASIARINRLIFDENSPALKAFAKTKGLTDLSFTPWTEDNTRDMSYLIPKTSIVKANHATEHQKYLVKSRGAYVVDILTDTPEVPYGKDFVTKVQVKITELGEKKAHVKVTAELEFFKSLMMKGMILRGAKSGMTDTYEMLFEAIRDSLNHRGKRRGPSPAAAEKEQKMEKPWLAVSLPSLSSTAFIIILQSIVIAVLFFYLWQALDQQTTMDRQLRRMELLLAKYVVDKDGHS